MVITLMTMSIGTGTGPGFDNQFGSNKLLIAPKKRNRYEYSAMSNL